MFDNEVLEWQIQCHALLNIKIFQHEHAYSNELQKHKKSYIHRSKSHKVKYKPT